MSDNDKQAFGGFFLLFMLFCVGAASYVFYHTSTMDWAASIFVSCLLLGGSMALGSILESQESQLVAKKFPVQACLAFLVPWSILAYFLNKGTPLPVGGGPLVTFGYWFVVSTPFVLIVDLVLDRHFKINARILERFSSSGGGGSGGGSKSRPLEKDDEEIDFGFPINEAPDIDYDRSRYH